MPDFTRRVHQTKEELEHDINLSSSRKMTYSSIYLIIYIYNFSNVTYIIFMANGPYDHRLYCLLLYLNSSTSIRINKKKLFTSNIFTFFFNLQLLFTSYLCLMNLFLAQNNEIETPGPSSSIERENSSREKS